MKTLFRMVMTLGLLSVPLMGQSQCQPADEDGDDWTTAQGDCNDQDPAINPGAMELCDQIDNNCDDEIDNGAEGLGEACPAIDCAQIHAQNPDLANGYYYLEQGQYYCLMESYEGGWTLIKQDAHVFGTGYDSTAYNQEAFSYNQVLFQYSSGYVSAHCVYPDSLTGCNNLGFQFGSENFGVALNWGSSVCEMPISDYTASTSYVGGYDFTISHELTNTTLRLGTLEGISNCTTSDNYGDAYVNIYVRQ